MNKDLVIYTDGGSRGNPGQSACAFIAEVPGGKIFKSSKFLGIQTNNYAEYSGVILAIEWVIKNKYSSITFYLDSELVVKQLNGLYKVKNEDLKILNNRIKRIILENKLDVLFKNVPRKKNKTADMLVNLELDKQS